jgi:hypothetical protein
MYAYSTVLRWQWLDMDEWCKDRRRALLMAADRSHTSLVTLLLDTKADVNLC